MKKTFRSLAVLAATAWAIAASAAAVYVPTDQGAQRSYIAMQTSDLRIHSVASYTGDAKNAPTKKIDADKMADARTPDKVMVDARTPVALADANKLFGKTVDSRTPAMFQASAQGAKNDVDVGGHQQVAQTGFSPPALHLKQVGSQYLAKIETGRVTPQPSTDVGARSRMAVVI